MLLSFVDWSIIIAFFVISLGIGVYVSKKSGKSAKNFFLSGRNMPWWLLGISMVATTFAADTPGLVAGIVRNDGVYGNWVWWSFLLTGMLTVFFYSKLWRKSEITTDLEFYELRYSGKSAAFLRGFRAIYLGVFFNIVIMATVCLAAIKIGHVMFDFSAVESLVVSCSITVLYSMLGGLKGVILTDFVQFAIAITGSIWATLYIVQMPEIGGIDQLLSIPEVQSKTSLFPDFSNPKVYIPILIVPLAVQWWSVWYPGAEPGGGGYIVQRMLAAKNTKHATLATLLFTVVHYAVRPWPWIIIGLASLVIFPDLSSLAAAFPNLDENYIKNDLAYAAMLSYLPSGLLGLVVTSLIAAFMSTISTHLNWGSSYVVNDFYVRFLKPEASEFNKVLVGRLSTLVMMICSALLALILEEAKQAFDLLLQIGAGTGLLFILRWFWNRINPYSEIAAMLSSFIIAAVFFIGRSYALWDIESYVELIFGVVVTTIVWVLVSLLTKPTDESTIKAFEKRVFDGSNKYKNFKYKFIGFACGVCGVYAALFATGYFIYSDFLLFTIASSICLLSMGILIANWKRIIN
ncbi:sodium:solute symporter family protein [Psychroflexus sp. MES1-P1E]|jgi:SSS family solute:Na+ symporter|uniref:sodium:solute symporter family protein n=1 Tax=Psychroflexus sp. MES1-P1E TaxID=2058320 RepID=UPI000C7E28B1|nr:sodium:solute symporter family protein [Psychroflexus sp. MES1-P1E]PKG41532.1 Na+:solute symporter [Psychroflexus sp. MES1-P1E]